MSYQREIVATLARISRLIKVLNETLVAAVNEQTKSNVECNRQERLVTVTQNGEQEAQRDAQHNRSYALQKRNYMVQIALCIFTALAFGAAAYYASVARRQLDAMNSTLKAAQEQSAAATSSAQTASEALIENGKQFRIDERPYAIDEYVRIAAVPMVGRVLSGEVLWTNTGRTPLLEGHSYLRIDVLQREPTDYSGWCTEARNAKSTTGIGSGLKRSVPVNGNNPLSSDWYTRIVNRTFHVYIFGCFVYTDVFNDPHQSRVCARYDPGSTNELFLWACENKTSNEIE